VASAIARGGCASRCQLTDECGETSTISFGGTKAGRYEVYGITKNENKRVCVIVKVYS